MMTERLIFIHGLLKQRLLFLLLSALSISTWAGERIDLPQGEFNMGSSEGMPDERPVRRVSVKAFSLDKSPVSVAEFRAFVENTGYLTSAEKFGNSGVFNMSSGRWEMVDGANWRHPLGPDQPQAPADHPVTQVSWHDADAYCRAAGGRLPQEAEFEYAAKGAGQYGDPTYAFGDDIKRDGEFLVNVFTGSFPFKNTSEDGYTYTAPIGKTGITPLGFTDMAGNVWEWSSDWYGPYAANAQSAQTEKSLRGGSFLCDQKVCHGYRTTARSHSTTETSLVHMGFRCAFTFSSGHDNASLDHASLKVDL